jgi:hypothetical protein
MEVKPDDADTFEIPFAKRLDWKPYSHYWNSPDFGGQFRCCKERERKGKLNLSFGTGER